MEILNVILFKNVKQLFLKPMLYYAFEFINVYIFKGDYEALFEKGLLFIYRLRNPVTLTFSHTKKKIFYNVIFILFCLNLEAN